MVDFSPEFYFYNRVHYYLQWRIQRDAHDAVRTH